MDSNSSYRSFLGLRTSALDCRASLAELVFGKVLRILSEFVLPDDHSVSPCTFLIEFRDHIRVVHPVLVTHHHKRKIFIYKTIAGRISANPDFQFSNLRDNLERSNCLVPSKHSEQLVQENHSRVSVDVEPSTTQAPINISTKPKKFIPNILKRKKVSFHL